MSLRARILVIFLLSGAAGAIGLLWWMSSEVEPRYFEAQEDLMVDISQLLAQVIEGEALVSVNGRTEPDAARISELLDGFPDRPVDAQIYVLQKQGVDLRVYVTNSRGRVVFDSDNQRDLGEDYSQWRDVRRTLDGEYGARTSENDPLFAAGSVMYAAAPLKADDAIVGVVSVGKPTRNAKRFLASAIERFLAAAAIATLGTLLLAVALYRWVSLPLQRLHGYARNLEAGRRVPVPDLGRNELGRIGRAMDDLRQALDGKTYVERYTQALTHELKSPTAAIRGAAELLQEDPPPEDRARFLHNIRREAERLQELIDRLLELAALENRSALEDPRPVDFRRVVDDCVAGQMPLIQQRGLQVEQLHTDDEIVAGDAFLLHRAVDNMLRNAIEFSPAEGCIRIAAHVDPATALLTLSISDQGPGIPDYARARIFERFYSLPRPDGARGSGLGLNFVREIAKLHGGDIEVEDAPGGGVVATLTLPLANR